MLLKVSKVTRKYVKLIHAAQNLHTHLLQIVVKHRKTVMVELAVKQATLRYTP